MNQATTKSNGAVLPPAASDADWLGATQRLLHLAEQDTGGARRARSFLLAWWNADTCGGFDLTDLAAVDRGIARDMLTIVQRLAAGVVYPDSSNPVTAKTDIPCRIEKMARERIAAKRRAESEEQEEDQ